MGAPVKSSLAPRGDWREYRHAVTRAKLPGKSEVVDNIGWKTPGLMHYAWKCGIEGKHYQRDRQGKADRGTLAHHWIEQTLRGEPLTPIEGATEEMVVGATRAFEAFQAWRAAKAFFDVLAVEVPLVDSAMGFGSTIDAVLRVGDWSSPPRGVVTDWKSGKIYPEMVVGMAAQLHLWNLHNPPEQRIQDALIVRFPVDGTPAQEVFLGPEILQQGTIAFVAALTLHNVKSQIKLPTASIVGEE